MSKPKKAAPFNPDWRKKFEFKASRYSMLAQYDPNRTYFESKPVSDLEIKLLPHSIKDISARLDKLNERLATALKRPPKAIRPLPRNAKNEDKEARAALVKTHGDILGLQMDIRRLAPLLEAYKLRLTERD